MKLCAIYISLLLLSPSSWADKITLPAGVFHMGCSVDDRRCGDDEAKLGGVAVKVNSFQLDSTEVTVKDYLVCMKGGQCERPKDFERNKYCNLGHEQRLDHPVNCVDWQQAVDYCAFKGGRLPYEAEWEYAARAETKSAFPWGKEVTCKQAILDDGKTMGSVPNEPDGCGEDRTWPIKSRSANKFGLYDMHGNVGEWTQNWYSSKAITQFYSQGKLDLPQSGRQRVVRGGSWDENRANLRSSFRNVKPPVSGRSVYGSIGFRCAYDH